MHLKQAATFGKKEFTYGVCRPFTKNKELKNLKKQEIETIFTKMN